MDSHTVPPILRFGEYELDPDVGELRRNGTRLKLQPQPFKLLLLLLRRSGAIVTSVETALFEMLGEAGTDEFKQVQRLIR